MHLTPLCDMCGEAGPAALRVTGLRPGLYAYRVVAGQQVVQVGTLLKQ